MAIVVNDRDALLQAASPRYTAPSGSALLIAASAPAFTVATTGTPTPASITFNAVRLNVTGAATFSASDGATLTVSGDTAALAYANMPANSTTVTVSVTDGGTVYSRSVTVSKVFEAGVTYTWVKYADSAAGAGISDDPTGKAYIGFAYNKTVQAESNNPADYTWSLIKGGDGVPGAKGADGTTYYTWIKYADQPDGTGLYDVPTANTLYIGIAVNRTTATESTVKTDYSWSKFKGDQGVPGVTTYTWIKYADTAAGAGLSDSPTGKAYIGLAYNKSTATESTAAADYTWSLIKGTDGVKGDPGADGTTLYTWIKYSDNADGTGLYDLPTASTVYIGIAVNKTTATESTNKADYVWSKFKGDQGVPGTGQRGPGWFYVVGSSWSDTAAHIATPGDTQVDDTVTISDGTVTYTKRWNGTAWYVPGAYMDGSLFVEKAITAAKINTNGIEVRDATGNLILSAGGLQSGFEAPNTKNSDLDPVLSAAATRGAALNDDPAIENPAAWVVGAGIVRYTIGSTVAGSVGQNFFHAPGAIRDKKVYTAKAFPVDANKVYDLSAVLYAGPGNDRDILVFIDFYDKAGDRIASNGWGSVQSHSGFAFRGQTPTGIWTRQGAKIGKNTARTIPATARTALIGVWFQYGGTGTSSVEQDAQDIRLDDVAEAFAAQAAADAAQADADAINQTLDAIASDNKLTKGEKPGEYARWLDIEDEYPGLDAQAAALAITTSRTNYQTYYTALASYISSLGAEFSTIPGNDITIVGSTYRARFSDYAYYRRLLLNEMLNAVNAKANAANTALADKLSKSAASTLTAPISLSTTGGIVAGTLTWASGGTRTGGYGVAHLPSGIVAYNSAGVATFVLEAATGNATFRGALDGAAGNFGAVTLAAGGSFRSGQTAYDTGSGWWMGYVGGVLKFSIGIAGGGAVLWDGTTLKIRQATLEGTGLGGPSLTLTSSPDPHYYTYLRTGSNLNAGSISTSVTGTGPYTYAWTISGNAGNRVLASSNGYSSSTISLTVTGGGVAGSFDWYVTCTVTDSKGLTATKTSLVTVEFT